MATTEGLARLAAAQVLFLAAWKFFHLTDHLERACMALGSLLAWLLPQVFQPPTPKQPQSPRAPARRRAGPRAAAASGVRAKRG